MMKNTLLFLVLAATATAQNLPPAVSITDVSVDEVAQQLTFTYQLTDFENDPCEVWLKFSTDGGEFFALAAPTDLTADAGTNILPGAKTLVWDYSAHADGIFGTRIRIVASDGHSAGIASMVSQVSEAGLLASLETVNGIRHYNAAPQRLEEVRSHIETQFAAAGLQSERHAFTYANTGMGNIIGRLAGLKDEAVTYIIDAHFDGVSNGPAADDNGSGVAGVLEALRILSQYDFEHSIRFIGFDAEELGLIGSQRYVQNGIKPYEDLQGVLNFEMIGFYSDEPNSQMLPAGFDQLFPQAAQQVADNEYRGDFLTVVGNTASNPLTTAFVDASTQYVPDLSLVVAEVPGTGTIAPDLRRSDHARFWDAGKKALMLTDASEFRNYNYHTPGDSIGTLNFTFMANVVKATLATAAQLAVPISAGHDDFDLSILSVDDDGHSHGFPAEVRIYPNPTGGLLSLETGSVHAFRTRAEVYDLSGRQLLRKVMEFGNGSSVAVLDVSDLANGSYMLVLDSGEGSVSRSFVVEH
ncbi:MAG: M28 family peptidase [Flavobacteriales bacterium]|nr:M28 family peptidase [Flavobacteriales bacterium]